MTSKAIEEQIAAIRAATAKASVSKEAAATFLIDAGIIEGPLEKYVSNGAAIQGMEIILPARKAK